MKPLPIVAALAFSLLVVAFAEEAKKADPAAKPQDPAAKPQDPAAKPGEGEAAKARPELKTLEDKTSYAIGVSVGRNLRAQGYEADLSLVKESEEEA